jgi:hypothetical protein
VTVVCVPPAGVSEAVAATEAGWQLLQDHVVAELAMRELDMQVCVGGGGAVCVWGGGEWGGGGVEGGATAGEVHFEDSMCSAHTRTLHALCICRMVVLHVLQP